LHGLFTNERCRCVSPRNAIAQFKPARRRPFPFDLRCRCVGDSYPRSANWIATRILAHVVAWLRRGLDVVAVSTAHGTAKALGDAVRMLRDAFPSCRSLPAT
jgi:hypothetical protein